MSETIKPATPSSFKWDEGKVKAKIQEARDYMQKFVGRAGYNAYFWIKNNLTPLEDRLNKSEQSEALYNAFMNLKLQEPIAKGAEHNAINPPKEHAAAGNSSNAGQVHMAAGMPAPSPQQKVN